MTVDRVDFALMSQWNLQNKLFVNINTNKHSIIIIPLTMSRYFQGLSDGAKTVKYR